MYATLMDESGERELNTLSDKKARTMTGSVVASLAHLKDINGNDGAFFVFPDLSVRCEGVYRLKFSLFEIVGNQVFFCKSITSTMFTVYSAKKFPGMEESTRLTKLFAEQGLKIRVRKEQKSARPKGNRSRLIASVMHHDGASPSQPPLMTWNIDHRQSMSGSGAYSGHQMQYHPHHQPHPHHHQSQQQQQPLTHSQSQNPYPNTMANPQIPSVPTANPLPSRPTPPSTWNHAHVRRSSMSGSRVALSQSPQPLQPHSISQYAPAPDIQNQQYSEADGAVGYAHNRHVRHQNHPQHYQQQQQQQQEQQNSSVLRTASPVVNTSHYRGHHIHHHHHQDQQQQQQHQHQHQHIQRTNSQMAMQSADSSASPYMANMYGAAPIDPRAPSNIGMYRAAGTETPIPMGPPVQHRPGTPSQQQPSSVPDMNAYGIPVGYINHAQQQMQQPQQQQQQPPHLGSPRSRA
ncbi:hypothetical protein FB639_000324, partial [Coemansia asiatica]